MKGVSLSMSIIGEWYLGWGWPAIFIGGWLHGRLAKAANTLRDAGKASSNPIVYGLAVMVLVSGMRSMLDLIIMSYALVAWWGVNRLLTRPRARPPIEDPARRRVLPAGGPLRRHDRVGARPVPRAGASRTRRARLHDQRGRARPIRRCRTTSPWTIDGVKVWYFQSQHGAPVVFRAVARRACCALTSTSSPSCTPTRFSVAAVDRRRSAAQAAGVPYVVSPRGMLEKELIENKSPLLEGGADRLLRKAHARAGRGDSRHQPARSGRGSRLRIRPAADVRDSKRRRHRERRRGERCSPAIEAIVSAGPYALFLGRINWKKGLDRLIRALAHAPQTRLVIAGNDEEGYRKVLEPIAAALGVADRVVFAGQVDGADKACLLEARAAAGPAVVFGELRQRRARSHGRRPPGGRHAGSGRG